MWLSELEACSWMNPASHSPTLSSTYRLNTGTRLACKPSLDFGLLDGSALTHLVFVPQHLNIIAWHTAALGRRPPKG